MRWPERVPGGRTVTDFVSLTDLAPTFLDFAGLPIPDWMQGRTAYGGVTSGLLLGAVQRLFPDLPPVRSALVNFTAPVGENPLLTARILRQGRNVTTVEARAEVDGQTTATAALEQR